MKNHVGSISKSLFTSFETTDVRLFTCIKSIIKLSCIWKVYEENIYLNECDNVASTTFSCDEWKQGMRSDLDGYKGLFTCDVQE